MLSKSHRFHGYGSLKNVYARGQSVRGSLISLKYTNRGPARPYRVAIVVSRKVSKSAVVRNRIRRRIYEQVRLNADLIAPGTDLIFLVYGEQTAVLEAAKLSGLIKDLVSKTV